LPWALGGSGPSVADASGARVLRGQDRIGRPDTARPVLDPEHRELGKH
jgi:hypothetical protein